MTEGDLAELIVLAPGPVGSYQLPGGGVVCGEVAYLAARDGCEYACVASFPEGSLRELRARASLSTAGESRQ
jgi:hypothetical protein